MKVQRMQGLMAKDELTAGVCGQFVFSSVRKMMLLVFFLFYFSP